MKHHIIPKSKGGKGTIDCCSDCGEQLHMLFTNKELCSISLEEIIASSRMQTYINWKEKHLGNHRHKSSKKLREWKKFHMG